MSITADEIINLAKNTKALSKEQLDRILKLAPDMDEEDLMRLKTVLLGSKDESERKSNLEALGKKISMGYLEWNSDKNRKALQSQESESANEDSAQADALINKI